MPDSRIAISLILLLLYGCSDRRTVTPVPSPLASISPPISVADAKAADRYRQIGLQYRKQGNLTKSLQALEKSVTLNPTHLSGRVILGWTQHLAQKTQQSRKTLEETLKIAPDHVPALNALGIVYLVAGDLPKAIATHTRAAQLKPDNEIAYYNLSLAYHRTGELDRAVTQAQKAIALEPHNPHPLVALALIYQEKGEKNLARATYQRAIALDNRYRQRWFLAHLAEAGFSADQLQKVEKLR
jgi:tetratricopeptide (TPR) repeat protein